ncbi:MAG: heme ABC exporter ATP-binding protein CcmA [Anaerolineaceae bacterium]
MLLEVNALTKRYGRRKILKDLDLSLRGGEVACLLGPNGAGKTTLLRVLSGLASLQGGQISLDGQPIDFKDQRLRRRIGLIMHQPFLYENLTGLENLRFYAELYQTNQSIDMLKTALERVGLNPTREDPVRAFSRGMKQRLTVARALLHDPDILLMDEPYTGLDQQGCKLLNQILLEEKQAGRLILITTHELDFARQVADRFITLHLGKIADQFENHNLTLDRIQARYQAITLPREIAAGGAS